MDMLVEQIATEMANRLEIHWDWDMGRRDEAKQCPQCHGQFHKSKHYCCECGTKLVDYAGGGGAELYDALQYALALLRVGLHEIQ